MRPEVTAFRELDALVRNLSDQLAGYRRRAMTSEARVRQLDLMLASARDSIGTAQAQQAVSQQALSALEAKLVRAESATRESEAQRVSSVRSAAAQVAEARASAAATVGAAPASDADLIRENAELRALLAAARERTTQLVERVRFLRQQIAQGADK